MLDYDLAELYGVLTSRLNEQIKRNINRFPEDFAFQLNDVEFKALISQIATSKVGRGGRRKLPYVFTEHGVAMLSSVLNSDRAIKMNIYIIKTFIRIREILNIDKNLEIELLKFKDKLGKHNSDIDGIKSILRRLTDQPVKPKEKLGFRPR